MTKYINSQKINNDFHAVLHENFNILYEVDLRLIQHNFEEFASEFQQFKSMELTQSDKFIFIHYDIDYYLPSSNYSLSILNLCNMFDNLDISLSSIIFITNHVGIRNSFNDIIPTEHQYYNFPYIIDNLITIFNTIPKQYNINDIYDIVENKEIDIEKIKYNALCMIGMPRMHRNIIYNKMVDMDLLNNIVYSYNMIHKKFKEIFPIKHEKGQQ